MKIDEIIRTKRKSVALIVQPDGRLVVRAPLQASDRFIQELVAQRADWIRARQQEVLAHPPPAAPQYGDGERFLYLGQAYPLELVGQVHRSLTLQEGVFRLRRAERGRAAEVFEAWYREQARQVLTERAAYWAARGEQAGLGPLKFRSLRIMSARTRWGSCGPGGTLNFNWRLVLAPMAAVDYVVVHELAHLVQRNHSKNFWEIVARLLPDYKKQVAWLKKNGRTLV